MKASVIIPNLNGAGWLRDSIESIWAQTEQDFELIPLSFVFEKNTSPSLSQKSPALYRLPAVLPFT